MRAPLISLTALLVIELSTPTGATIQTAAPDYRALVDAYRNGLTTSTERVAAASREELQSWIDRAADAAGAWDWPSLRAAAILHTEVWLRAASEAGPQRAVNTSKPPSGCLRASARLRPVKSSSSIGGARS